MISTLSGYYQVRLIFRVSTVQSLLKYSRDKIRPKIKFWVEQIFPLFQDALATDLIVFVDKCGFLAFLMILTVSLNSLAILMLKDKKTIVRHDILNFPIKMHKILVYKSEKIKKQICSKY